MKKILLLIVSVSQMLSLYSQKTTIEDILNNSNRYKEEVVEVEGTVVQYVPADAQSTSYFLLQSDYGNQIRVNTSQSKPETFKKYRIKGVLYYDDNAGTVFISEQSRTPLDVQVVQNPIQPSIEETKDNSLLYFLIAAGIVILIILIIIISRFFQAKKQDLTGSSVNTQSLQTQTSSSLKTEILEPSTRENDFKTIKIF